jgi:hypothetical protein
MNMNQIVLAYLDEKISENKDKKDKLDRIFKILREEDILIVSHEGADYVYLSDPETFSRTETFLVHPSVAHQYYNYFDVLKEALSKLLKINPERIKEVLEILLE